MSLKMSTIGFFLPLKGTFMLFSSPGSTRVKEKPWGSLAVSSFPPLIEDNNTYLRRFCGNRRILQTCTVSHHIYCLILIISRNWLFPHITESLALLCPMSPLSLSASLEHPRPIRESVVSQCAGSTLSPCPAITQRHTPARGQGLGSVLVSLTWTQDTRFPAPSFLT